ncbi:hypothetical protein [Gimesia chilikensis]|uniref:hypothetical protein n=1 Tax=Gimesia chilikensis TaxID=2605989 RepID=UPI003A920BEC
MSAVIVSSIFHSNQVFSDDIPHTIEDAHQRLIKIFGQSKDPARLTRFKIDEEIETQPDPDDPKVVVVNKGAEYFTNPVIQGDSIIYYANEILERDVFNETSDGQRKLNRHVERTYAARVRITLFAPGLWIVEERLENHSLPKYSGMTVSTGTVKWIDDGVEYQLAGSDAMYQPDGSTKPTAFTSTHKYTLQDNKVILNGQMQVYETATSPLGLKLLVPDFNHPSGKLISYSRVSEPRE